MSAWTHLPISVDESAESREMDFDLKGSQRTQTRIAIVTGYTEAEDAAQAAVDLPSTPFPLLIPASMGKPAMAMIAAKAKPLTPNAWEIAFSYESRAYDDTEALTWTFSGTTLGKTQLVTQSYATSIYGSGAANFGSAINVDQNGVKGVEIGIPGLEFQIEKTLAKGVLTLVYVMTLVNLTYKTNNAAFRNFAQGELLFLGAEFRNGSNQEVTVVFKFSASPNRTGLSFGTITGVAKKGHEYLWIDYEAWESGGFVIRRPRGVYVERVYEEGNFALLGI
jgi:hypothetical protein